MARAGELGANNALMFLREVDSINMRRRTRMVEMARSPGVTYWHESGGSRCRIQAGF